MRNTTKLKTLLLKYSATFTMSDDGNFRLLLIDAQHNNGVEFEAASYSLVVGKAYAWFMRELKKEEAAARPAGKKTSAKKKK